MNPQIAQNYLRTKVLTATPEQLQLMLFDGALRFGEQAKVALNEKRFEKSYELIGKVQKIIAEFQTSLRHDVNRELCGKLSALYNYIYRKLIEANVDHTVESLDEALSLLRYQRETWILLLDQIGKSRAAAKATMIDMPQPDDRMEASIRLSA